MLFRIQPENIKIESARQAKKRSKKQRNTRALKILKKIKNRANILEELKPFFDLQELQQSFILKYFERDQFKFNYSFKNSIASIPPKSNIFDLDSKFVFSLLKTLKWSEFQFFLNGKAVQPHSTTSQDRRLSRAEIQNIHDSLKKRETGLRINGIHRFHPGVEQLLSSLKRLFGCEMTASLYCNFCEGSILAPHWDDHDVLVFQIEGIKEWRFAKNTYDLPCRYFRIIDETKRLKWTSKEVLQNGDILYVPRGMWHQTKSKHSIHLTVGFAETTYASVVHDAIINGMIKAFNTSELRSSMILTNFEDKTCRLPSQLKRKVLQEIASSLDDINIKVL